MNKKKKKIIIVVITAVCVVAAGILIAVLVNGNAGKESSDNGKSATESQQQYEKDKKDESAQEAIQKTDENRAEKYTDELFRLCVNYADEKSINTDDFTVVKALVVQDLENDYFYFQCKYSGKTEYACYSYDDHEFRNVSQKTLKAEYEEAQAVIEYGGEEVDYDVYYELTKNEIKEVNSMF